MRPGVLITISRRVQFPRLRMRTNQFPYLLVSLSKHLPIRRFSQYLASVKPAANRLGSIQWVLSRPLYRFARFDFKHIGNAQRAQALKIQIRQWSPYTNTGQYVVWGREHALIWAWDADRLANDLAAQQLAPGSARVVPETLLRPAISSGLRLVACMDGVEGQFWQEQRLVQCRWWPASPAADEWTNFQRDASVPQDQRAGVPVVQVPNWLHQPWAASVNVGALGGHSMPQEAWIIRGVTLLLAAFSIWYGIEIIKARQATGLLRAQFEEAAKSANPLLEARRRALDARARIESLQATNLYPSPLALMAMVGNNLPKNGTFLNEWDYQNGKLKFTVVSPDKISSSVLVKKLLDASWFTNVQAGPSGGANTLTLTMDILPLSEIARAVPDTSGLTDKDDIAKTIDPMKPGPRS